MDSTDYTNPYSVKLTAYIERLDNNRFDDNEILELNDAIIALLESRGLCMSAFIIPVDKDGYPIESDGTINW